MPDLAHGEETEKEKCQGQMTLRAGQTHSAGADVSTKAEAQPKTTYDDKEVVPRTAETVGEVAKCETPREAERATTQVEGVEKLIAKTAKHAGYDETRVKNEVEAQSWRQTLKPDMTEGKTGITQKEKTLQYSGLVAGESGGGIELTPRCTKKIGDEIHVNAADDVMHTADATKHVTETKATNATVGKRPEDAESVADNAKELKEEAGLLIRPQKVQVL